MAAEGLNFDIHLNWPVTLACSLRCVYCRPRVVVCDQSSLSEGRIESQYSSLPGPIDIERLIRTLDGTGKVVKVVFNGGEPFLVPNFVDVLEAVTVRHRAEIITNLVTGDVEGLIQRIPEGRGLSIFASLHIQELERRGLTKKFIDRFLALKKAGFYIFATEVGYPPFAPDAVRLRRVFQEQGVPFKFKLFRGWFSGRLYPEAYTDEELRAFDLKLSVRPLLQTLGKLCNAGVNQLSVVDNGDVYPCPLIKESMGNLYEGIRLRKTMTRCTVERCGCPLFYYESALYQKALEDVSKEEALKTHE